MNARRAIGIFFAYSWGLAAGASAQATPSEPPVDYVAPGQVTRLADRPQGWSYALTLAANLSATSNRDVVGQLEGSSVLLGGSIISGVSYVQGPHEWVNSGSLFEAWSRTPALERFVKSNDLLDLQTLYNYFINDWTGPFTRLAIQTTLLKTERQSAQQVDYTREDDLTEVSENRTRFRVSDPFQPFTLNESLGWFVQPLRSESLNLYGRAGFGGRHTFADGVRTVDPDAAITATEATYTVLQDVHQGGAEIFAGLDGKQVEGRLVYNVGATVLFPFINNDDRDRSVLELTRVGLAGAVGIGVFSWLSVNYQLKVVRDIQLVDAVQVQNALLLSFQYAVTSPEPKPAEEPGDLESQARISELEARATAAEQRAAEAEARAAEAEARAAEPAPVGP
jgi:hypothetical protein